MRIGIVVPAFNAAPWIGDAIASVIAQTHCDWTMVVVDDGSTDGTAGVVQQFGDARIRLIRQPNAGVSAARNRGMAEFTGVGGLLFLDADDWLAPDALRRLAGAFDMAPGAVAAAGGYAVVETGGAFEAPSGEILERLLVRNLFANGGHLLLRRSAVQAVGEFLPKLAYGEDWEFWIRIALQGPFAATTDSAPVLFVRQHPGGAYQRLATDPAAFAPCMAAIFANPALLARFGPPRLAAIRRRTEAENHWIIGRELIRHGRAGEGRAWLRRSLCAAPSLKRAAMFAAAHVLRCGPFRPYAVAGRTRVNRSCSEPSSPCGRKMMNTTRSVP
jgi:glycosyltransferase involved in cell wall biosynthesis